MAGLTLIPIRTAAAAVAAFVAVLALHLALSDVRPGQHDQIAAYLGHAQSLADGDRYGLPLYIPQPDNPQDGNGLPAAFPPLYPLALVPVVLLAPEPVRATAQLDAVLGAALAAGLVLYGAADVGLVAALGLAAVAGLSPAFINPGAFRAPAGALALLLLVVALLAARLIEPGHRRGPALLGAATLLGTVMAMVALTDLPGALLAPALLMTDVLRRRRVAWPAALAVLVAVLLFAAAVLVCGPDFIAPVVDRAAADTGLAGTGLAGFGRRVAGNLLLLPQSLSVFWAFDGPAGAGAWAGSLAMLGAGAAGLVLRVRRGITLAEPVFALQAGLLLGQAEGATDARGWLAPSMLMLLYAVAGGQALGRRLLGRRLLGWRASGARWPGVGAATVIAVAAALALADAPPPQADDGLMDAAAQAGLRRIRLTIPPNAVLVGPDPRALAFFTGRAAAGLRLAPADPGFWPWVAAVRATHMALPTAGRGVPRLDIPGIDLVLDTGRYRLYRLLGPPPESAPR